MSRAFVNEDASASSEAEAPELKIPIPPGSRNYLTPEGAEDLSRELHRLTGSERPRLVSELAALTAAGTSPDPDELAALRRRLGELDRRIAYLDAMSSLAEVVPPPPPDGRDRVKFGARVRVRVEGEASGAGAAGEAPSSRAAPGAGATEGAAMREIEYRIVGVDEAAPERGLIGWPSPVARALIGRRVGDETTVRLPVGARRMKVLSIVFLEP